MNEIKAPSRTASLDWACLLTAAVLGGLGVALSAFGAHGLKDSLGAEQLGWWQTGVQQQLWHGVALLALALLPGARPAAMLMALGTIIFSGSLYAMALGGPRWLGAVTPLGGLLMIAGWLALAHLAVRLRKGGYIPEGAFSRPSR